MQLSFIELMEREPEEVAFRSKFQVTGGESLYELAQKIVYSIEESRLNDWQRRVLFPHLYARLDDMHTINQENLLIFEVGYIVGCLECEMLISRAGAQKIAEGMGLNLMDLRPRAVKTQASKL